MAYSGFLLSVGSYRITGKNFINYASYEVTRNIQDLDSYRDANGNLHRNALSHVPIKVTFETRPGVKGSEMAEFLGNIAANYTTPAERKANVTVFVPELNDYVTQPMYMAGPTMKIRKVTDTEVIYESCKISFIGY